MWTEHRVLAVVPARGGSKAIPRKNLELLGGKSLVRHAIELALGTDWIDMTVLSTDDDEIAREGEVAGIEIPYRRPAHLATDLASGHSVWRHAHLEAERTGSRFEISMLIQPTSPFRDSDDLHRCVELLLKGNFDAVTTVSPTPSHFAPEKTLILDESGGVQPYLVDGFQPTRQMIPPYYHLNGICYTALRSVVLEHENVFGGETGAIVIDRPLVNIDDPYDLKVARWLWDERWLTPFSQQPNTPNMREPNRDSQ